MVATVDNTKIACLYLGDTPVGRGTFAAMKNEEKQKKQQGYSPNRLRVGYAPFYRGTAYCKTCASMVVKPYLAKYEGHEYWRCDCGTINYVN